MRPRRRPAIRFFVSVVVLGAIGAGAWSTTRHKATPDVAVPPTVGVSWQGLVGTANPVVSLTGRMIVVLRTPSVADNIARVKFATEATERRWTAEAFAAQQQVLTQLARHGLSVRPDYSFARVLDGFSATLDPRAVALLEQNPQVAGVFPVRAAYPATVSTGALEGATNPLNFASGLRQANGTQTDGTGISIALLDTGVDLKHAYLGGRVEPGVDIVGAATDAAAQRDPQAHARLEQHGTELAGILVGSDGPGGLRGVAPGATVDPIRVAGWQPAASGRDAIYGRSDQLIAGLDRAVDPNRDGDTHDAPRIALIGEAEPFASFADSPEAQAVAGALALDVLVITPAGNDGAVGPLYGSLAGPAGSPAALAVGTTDSRQTTSTVRVVLTRGLNVVADAALPLLDAGAIEPFDVPIGVPGDPDALSGKAALVPAGPNPGATVAAAVHDGAKAVLIYGRSLPAGSLGEAGVPVAQISEGSAREALALIRQRFGVEASFGHVSSEPNQAHGRVASFSSRGLSFDGLLEPQLSAPGVGIGTSAAGSSADATAAFASVTGTSASAAVVAGAAALIAQSRPGLSAIDIASLLTGSAHASGASATAAGAGAVDVGASAAGEVTASVTSLGFGPWTGSHWHATHRVVVHNISTRALTVTVRSSSSLLAANPAKVVLEPGRQATVRIEARASKRPALAVVTGIVSVRPAGSQALRIPWAIEFHPPVGALIRQVRLDPLDVTPSDKNPAVLQIVAGRIAGTASVQIEPVGRLDVLLYRANGAFVGVLSRLDDLLPGAYSLGITGRDPDGTPLAPGSYELRLVAWPIQGKTPTRRQIAFRIQ